MAVYIHSRMENFRAGGNIVTAAFFRQKVDSYLSSIENRISELETKKKEIENIEPDFLPIMSAAIGKTQKNGKRSIAELMNDITNDFRNFKGDGNAAFRNGTLEVYLDNDSSGAKLVKDLNELSRYVTVAKMTGKKGTGFLNEMEKYPFFKYFSKKGSGSYKLSKEEFYKIFYNNQGLKNVFDKQKGYLSEHAIAYTGRKLVSELEGTNVQVTTKVWGDNASLSDVNFIISREGYKSVSFNIESKNYSELAKWSKESDTTFENIFNALGIGENAMYSILNTVILSTRRLDDLSSHPIQRKRLWGTLEIGARNVNFNASYTDFTDVKELYQSIAMAGAIERYLEQVKAERVASVIIFNDSVYWYVDHLKQVYNWIESGQYDKLTSVRNVDASIKNIISLKQFSALYVNKSKILKENTLKNNPNATKPEYLNEAEWRSIVTGYNENAINMAKTLEDIEKNFKRTVVKHKMWAVPKNIINS